MKDKLLFWVLLVPIVIIFWFTYGVVHFPSLNSDHAIQIIMLPDFKLPYDLYYMGQDRLGSIIPLIALPFYWMGFSAMVATTISQITILCFVGFVLWNLFKNKWLASLVLILTFFPASDFDVQVSVGHPALGQLFILALAIAAFKKWGLEKPVFLVFIGLGMWASGMFAANVAAAGLIYLLSKKIHLYRKSYWIWIGKSILWSLPGFALLILAKITSSPTDLNYKYSGFTSWPEFFQNLKSFWKEFLHFFTFEDPDKWICLCLILFLALSLLIVTKIFKQKLTSWSTFFLLSGIIAIAAILSSHWAFAMDFPRRYFNVAYFQLAVGIALVLDSPKTRFHALITQSLLVLLVLSTAISGFYSLNSFWKLNQGKPYRKDLQNMVPTLPSDYILGSYWTVYIAQAFKPATIHPLVNEAGINRDYAAMRSFLNADTVTIIQNYFLSRLEDTVYDHGVFYYKTSPTQTIGELKYASYYRGKKFLETYLPQNLHYNYGKMVKDSTGCSWLRITPKDFNGNTYAVFGPYVTLPAGQYKVCFDLKAQSGLKGSFVDVNSNYDGVFAKRKISELPSDGCLKFTLKHPSIDLEFRINYYPEDTLYFKEIRLQKIH